MQQAISDASPRQRLLDAALKVFAAKGFGQASTREICRIAGTNAASIHYYFGDKASLYRALFEIPEQLIELPRQLDDPETSLEAGLDIWYRHVMSFVLAPEDGSHLRLLFLREQVESSGLLEPNRVGILGVYHAQLVRFLASRLGIARPDAAVHQLAFSLVGLAMVYFVERAAVRVLAPGLLDSEPSVNATVERLVRQAKAVVADERERRGSGT